MSPLKIKIPIKNLGRQRCAEESDSGVKGLVLGSQILTFHLFPWAKGLINF
jgi:hypothetical protein